MTRSVHLIMRHAGTLIALQAVMGGLAFLLHNIVVVGVMIGVVFVALVAVAGSAFGREASGQVGLRALAVGVLWQVPGLQGTIRFLTDRYGLTQYDGNTDLADFAMETWHTVLLPLLAVVPPGQVEGYYARYYLLLVAAAPVLMLIFCLSAFATGANRRASQ